MARRPNVVIVLVDDMGYSEVGCFGGEIVYDDELLAGILTPISPRRTYLFDDLSDDDFGSLRLRALVLQP